MSRVRVGIILVAGVILVEIMLVIIIHIRRDNQGNNLRCDAFLPPPRGWPLPQAGELIILLY